MSSYRAEKPFPFKALTAVIKYKVVKLAAGNHEVEHAGAGEGIGIAMNDADAGCFVEVAMIGGGAKGKAGATIVKGALLAADASGDVITAVATDIYIGIALEAATAGQVVSMERVYGVTA